MTSPPDEPAPRLAALRYHDFRLLWCGDLVSTAGSQMQAVAANWHAYRFLGGYTDSSVACSKEHTMPEPANAYVRAAALGVAAGLRSIWRTRWR